jgi:hypothetical protein
MFTQKQLFDGLSRDVLLFALHFSLYWQRQSISISSSEVMWLLAVPVHPSLESVAACMSYQIHNGKYK